MKIRQVIRFGAAAWLAACLGATTLAQTQQSGSGAETGLSIGQPVTDEPQVGQTYDAEEIGDWVLRCLKTEEPQEDLCQIYQLLVDGDEQPVAEVSLFRLPEGGRAAAGGNIVVPLETALQQPLAISIDGGPVKQYPYAFCNPVGCYVRIGLTNEDVAAFKAGREALITIVPALAPDQTVTLKLSLTGFTKGIEKASVLQQ